MQHASSIITLPPQTISPKGAPLLTSCQQKALDVLLREGNVFLTGAAGTGKSFLLNQYLSGKSTDAFPIVASTGAAAVLVSGRTFHSFFGVGIMEGGPEATIRRALFSRKLIRRLQRAYCVVIDEVSMLSGILLHTAETIARRARKNEAPWGGLRIITVGDFAQLPPISEDHRKDWAFLHSVWQESDFQPALLSTVMRTRDIEFLRILNFVREGVVNDDVQQFLDAHILRSSSPSLQNATRLYPRREQADRYNMERLEAIRRPNHLFQTIYTGTEKNIEKAKKSFPIPNLLTLKEGALIMMRKNDLSDERLYVNGSLGIIEGITKEILTIRLHAGKTINVTIEKFSALDGDGNEIATAWNFPVTLAWATTIHKSQGASLDRIIVNMENLWEPGHAYVALSRARSAEGLMIEQWNSSSISAEPLVTAFYNSLAESAKKYVPRPFFAVPERIEKDSELARKPRRRSPAKIIPMMIKAEESLEQMAAACGIKTDTVLQWIDKFIALGLPLNLGYLLTDISEAENIRTAFHQLGMERLKPVFDYFDGAISYSTLKLVRGVVMAEKRKN